MANSKCRPQVEICRSPSKNAGYIEATEFSSLIKAGIAVVFTGHFLYAVILFILQVFGVICAR